LANYLVRMLIAAVAVVLFNMAVPAFLTLLGLDMPAAMGVLIKVVTIAVALYYVVWGPPVIRPSA
jgi:hypothetical protein